MMRKIKILYTIPNFITAGSGQVMMNIITRLNREIFEPAVCVSKKGGKLDQEVEAMGIPFLEAPFTIAAKPYVSLLPRAWQSAQAFKPYQFDLWHSWHYVDDYTEPVIARLSGTKNWVYTKKNMSWGSRAWLLRSLLATRIAADNTEMQAAFFNQLGLSKKVRLIHHGIPTDQFSPEVPPKLGLRGQLGIPKEALVVGCVANLTVRKGHHILLEAISKIPDVYLITIGKPMEPEYVTRLEKLRQDLQLQERAFLQGYVEDVPAFLAEIDVFVLPTWDRGSKEGCPVALVEAMSSGRACIATNIPGSSDIIQDGISGFLVPAEDSDALADAIRKLAHNPQLRSDFSKAARLRAEQKFSIEGEVQGYETLYHDIVERKK
jgi:glycosyltransferase involved in cell wall biosynthesis